MDQIITRQEAVLILAVLDKASISGRKVAEMVTTLGSKLENFVKTEAIDGNNVPTTPE